MVQLGSTAEVVELVVDEHGLTIGPHGHLDWEGLEVATEVGPSWCTIRVVTSSAAEALFFVPADPFTGAMSPSGIAGQFEALAVGSGARVPTGGARVA